MSNIDTSPQKKYRTEFAKKAAVIHADIDPASISKNIAVDIPIVADAKNVIKVLPGSMPKVCCKLPGDLR